MEDSCQSRKFPELLMRAVAGAAPEDVEYSQAPAPCHPDLPDVRIAYKPIRVKSVDIPDWVWVSYIAGRSGHELYWYVISWRCNKERGQEWQVASDSDARRDVLEELRTWAGTADEASTSSEG